MTDEPTIPSQPTEPGDGEKKPKPTKNNPFKSGFVPNGKRKNKSQSYLHKRTLLRDLLDTPITIFDLPQRMADYVRHKIPGFLENVERKFTMRQIMELTQIQLLFSKSDYVKQDAINAIKDRIEGKPMQKVQVENLEADPTEIVLPGGRKIVI